MTCKVLVKGQFVKNVIGKHGIHADKEYSIPMINAYAQIPGERNPQHIEFGIPRPDSPDDVTGQYEPGQFVLGARSFYVDSDKRLCLRRYLVLHKPDQSTDLLLRVTVHGTKVHTGKDGTLTTVQDCDVHIPGEEFPVTALLPMRRDEVQPGDYFVGPESFEVGYRELRLLNAPQLLPWPHKKAA